MKPKTTTIAKNKIETIFIFRLETRAGINVNFYHKIYNKIATFWYRVASPAIESIFTNFPKFTVVSKFIYNHIYNYTV